MIWQNMNTAPRDGSNILLLTKTYGVCEAWFSPGEWSEDTPISPREYSGAAWVCCDDAFQIEVEEVTENEDLYYEEGVLGWMPVPSSDVVDGIEDPWEIFMRGVIHGQKALRQMQGKTFHVIDD